MFQFRWRITPVILEEVAAWIYFDEDADLLGSVQEWNKDSPVREAKVQLKEK